MPATRPAHATGEEAEVRPLERALACSNRMYDLKAEFAYRRSTTNHVLLFGGMLIGTVTL
jgi:hypothetical protein